MSEDKELREKEELLKKEIEEMLARENPVEGVYPMYGDHPSQKPKKKDKGFSPQNTYKK